MHFHFAILFLGQFYTSQFPYTHKTRTNPFCRRRLSKMYMPLIDNICSLFLFVSAPSSPFPVYFRSTLTHTHGTRAAIVIVDHNKHQHAAAAAAMAAATINALHMLGATDEHGAPVYRCHRCGRAYKTKYTCRRHERVECGLPALYSCSLCNYRAKHKHSVKQHFDCVHKKKLIKPDDEWTMKGGM